jgi:SPP1 family predicted phage head-tail adaptor
MRAGNLRHRIELQSKSDGTQNAVGEFIGGEWTSYAECWADVRSLGGREGEFVRSRNATATHGITIRVPRGYTISVLHQVKFGSRLFSINEVTDADNRGREQKLVCTENVSA